MVTKELDDTLLGFAVDLVSTSTDILLVDGYLFTERAIVRNGSVLIFVRDPLLCIRIPVSTGRGNTPCPDPHP